MKLDLITPVESGDIKCGSSEGCLILREQRVTKHNFDFAALESREIGSLVEILKRRPVKPRAAINPHITTKGADRVIPCTCQNNLVASNRDHVIMVGTNSVLNINKCVAFRVPA